MAKWMVHELLQWRTWVWDCLVFEQKGRVLIAKEEFIKGCNCESEMVATVDCTKDARVYVRDSLSTDSQREGVAGTTVIVSTAGKVSVASQPDPVSEPGEHKREHKSDLTLGDSTLYPTLRPTLESSLNQRTGT